MAQHAAPRLLLLLLCLGLLLAQIFGGGLRHRMHPCAAEAEQARWHSWNDDDLAAVCAPIVPEEGRRRDAARNVQVHDVGPEREPGLRRLAAARWGPSEQWDLVQVGMGRHRAPHSAPPVLDISGPVAKPLEQRLDQVLVGIGRRAGAVIDAKADGWHRAKRFAY